MMLVKFEPKHLENMDIDSDVYPLIAKNKGLLNEICSVNPALTIVTKDRIPVAVTAIMILWSGTAQVFIVPSKEAWDIYKKTYLSDVVRIRDELDEWARHYNLRCMYTTTVDNKKHNRWMQWLGFELCGTIPKFGHNGEDFNIWNKACLLTKH